MKIHFITLLALSTQAFAASGSIHYSTGPYKGKNIHDNGAHFGSDQLCFKGDMLTARNSLYKFMTEESYQYEQAFARVLFTEKTIVFGYTDSKCLDEPTNLPSTCREMRLVKACR